MFDRMGMMVIAEGIETVEEYEVLRNLGVRYMQGYLLARPALASLPLHILTDLQERGPEANTFSVPSEEPLKRAFGK